ncbi:MAG: hypothetical protein JNN20_10305 [Betaproteobacteria bacterium]|nr:hypothetical protein [Betaproteobacteria bacterium]
MEGVSPLQDEDTSVAEYNAQGWPRGLSLQLTRNLQTSKNGVPNSSRPETRTDTQGVQIDAYLETPDFGALSIHALALGGRGSTGLTNWNLRQTGLPFDGGWRADNAIGTTNLLVPELSRRNSRLALPTPQVLGGSTIWRNEANLLVLGASVGEPGRFEGFPQSRFVKLGGQVTSAFAQATSGQWTGAVALAQGNNILPEIATITGDNTNSGAPRISPRGVYSSVLYQTPTGSSWQASIVGSQVSGTNANGIWSDAIWRDGGQTQQISLFRFSRELAWIDRPLPSDLQGAAYRYDYRSLRWDVSANVESFDSLSGRSPSGWYVSASGRRMLSTALSTGGGVAMRNFGISGGSGFGYLQWQNALGVSRLQLDAASTRGDSDSQALTFDHSIYAENGMSLSTSLSAERLHPTNSSADNSGQARSRQNAVAAGLTGRAMLGNSMSLQGSLRARNVRGNTGNGVPSAESGTTLAANLSFDWQISRDWSLAASFYENRGVFVDTIGVQSPLVTPEIIRIRPNDRGFFLSLRYATRAGTPSIPLGGAPGSGAGRIEGSVFLDANGNGLRDANESGVANILVTLDGKFSTRTNAFGGFEFPTVVSGAHTLTVLQDDLPLPWTVDTEQKINAVVSTRDITRINIGARRMR